MEQQERTRIRHTRDERRDEILPRRYRRLRRAGARAPLSSSVTARVGCTRSLFYHYFPSKEAAFDAALEMTIDAFISRLRTWDRQRVRGDIEGALDGIAELLNRSWSTPRASRAPLRSTATPCSTPPRQPRLRALCPVYLREHRCGLCTAPRGLIDHVYETFYVLISGLILFIRSNPSVDTETLKDIIASTLHIEGYTAKYADRRPER